MQDSEISLPLVCHKAKMEQRVQTGIQVARNDGFSSRVLALTGIFDFRTGTLTRRLHKALFTKRIERIVGIDFLSGSGFQIRKHPFVIEKKTGFYKTNRAGGVQGYGLLRA